MISEDECLHLDHAAQWCEQNAEMGVEQLRCMISEVQEYRLQEKKAFRLKVPPHSYDVYDPMFPPEKKKEAYARYLGVLEWCRIMENRYGLLIADGESRYSEEYRRRVWLKGEVAAYLHMSESTLNTLKEKFSFRLDMYSRQLLDSLHSRTEYQNESSSDRLTAQLFGLLEAELSLVSKATFTAPTNLPVVPYPESQQASLDMSGSEHSTPPAAFQSRTLHFSFVLETLGFLQLAFQRRDYDGQATGAAVLRQSILGPTPLGPMYERDKQHLAVDPSAASRGADAKPEPEGVRPQDFVASSAKFVLDVLLQLRDWDYHANSWTWHGQALLLGQTLETLTAMVDSGFDFHGYLSHPLRALQQSEGGGGSLHKSNQAASAVLLAGARERSRRIVQSLIFWVTQVCTIREWGHFFSDNEDSFFNTEYDDGGSIRELNSRLNMASGSVIETNSRINVLAVAALSSMDETVTPPEVDFYSLHKISYLGSPPVIDLLRLARSVCLGSLQQAQPVKKTPYSSRHAAGSGSGTTEGTDEDPFSSQGGLGASSSLFIDMFDFALTLGWMSVRKYEAVLGRRFDKFSAVGQHHVEALDAADRECIEAFALANAALCTGHLTNKVRGIILSCKPILSERRKSVRLVIAGLQLIAAACMCVIDAKQPMYPSQGWTRNGSSVPNAAPEIFLAQDSAVETTTSAARLLATVQVETVSHEEIHATVRGGWSQLIMGLLLEHKHSVTVAAVGFHALRMILRPVFLQKDVIEKIVVHDDHALQEEHDDGNLGDLPKYLDSESDDEEEDNDNHGGAGPGDQADDDDDMDDGRKGDASPSGASKQQWKGEYGPLAPKVLANGFKFAKKQMVKWLAKTEPRVFQRQEPPALSLLLRHHLRAVMFDPLALEQGFLLVLHLCKVSNLSLLSLIEQQLDSECEHMIDEEVAMPAKVHALCELCIEMLTID